MPARDPGPPPTVTSFLTADSARPADGNARPAHDGPHPTDSGATGSGSGARGEVGGLQIADLTGVHIDLDRPVADAPAGPRTLSPRTRRGARVAVLAVFALAAGLPQSAPTLLSQGRPVPLPSFCTGTPIPGGRLNIIQGDNFIILDATTNTIVNSGRCPHGTGKLVHGTGN